MRNTLVAASLGLSSLSVSAAPLSILESVVCKPDASSFEDNACFILPGISAFIVLGELASETVRELDLSDFLQFSGLLADANYTYAFSQTGVSGFGFFYNADSVLEVFDSLSSFGAISSDSAGNLFAGVFLDEAPIGTSSYSLALNPVPLPASSGLLASGLLLFALMRKRRI